MKVIICISLISLSLTFGKCFSQASHEGNDLIGAPPNPFIGWDASVLNDPLEIRHDANQPILFSTNGTEHMRIAEYGNIGVGGITSPSAKFEVVLEPRNASQSPFESTAIFAFNRYIAPAESGMINRGVRSWSIQANEGEGPPGYYGTNFGGTFWARNAMLNTGLVGIAGLHEIAGPEDDIVGIQGVGIFAAASDHRIMNIALEARAEAHSNYMNAWTVGVLAGAGPTVGGNRWAGWFDGNVFISGTINPPSDAMFKDNIQDIEGALDLLNEIEPKTYHYQTGNYEFMNFPTELQYGVVAQDLAEVIPELTKDANKPAMVDSTGNEITPAIEFKTVNYTGLIPILIAGIKEQQSIIDSQNEALANVMDQLDDLQQQISNCCSGDTGLKNMRIGGEEEEQMQKSSPNGNVLGQNSPNPFRTQTTINYTLEQGGKVLLNVYDRNGKVLANLMEGEQPAGNFRYEWDASGLPAGLYHYALYVDGELLVKKAIKLKD